MSGRSEGVGGDDEYVNLITIVGGVTVITAAYISQLMTRDVVTFVSM